jgi:hypothetical protein
MEASQDVLTQGLYESTLYTPLRFDNAVFLAETLGEKIETKEEREFWCICVIYLHKMNERVTLELPD